MIQDLIGPDNVVTVGVGASIVAAAVVLTWKVAQALSVIKELKTSVTGLTEALHAKTTHIEMVNWIRLLKAKNPDLDVPFLGKEEQ